jgi:hypothetical protein
MKNALMKFAGFFVEKVPIEEPIGQQPAGGQHTPARQQQPSPQAPPTPQPVQQPAMAQPQPGLMQGHFPSPSGTVAMPPPAGQPRQPQQAPLAVALRAWVPQEYATYLTPFGLHVIAAGGELTIEQARAYGAQVLVVSAECLGSHTHLLSAPQLPTVFIAPQTVMIPPSPGVVQVQEPLRASEVAQAAREAVTAWASARM